MAKGTIRQKPDGKWLARLARSVAGGEQRPSRTFATQAEAETWLDVMNKEVARARRGQPGDTLRAWGEAWLDQREGRGLSYPEGDRGRWQRFIAQGPLGQLTLRAITPPRVAAWAEWLAQQPRLRQAEGGGYTPDPTRKVSRQTQVHARNLLRSALDAAVLAGRIPANPAARIKVVPQDAGVDDEAWTWLTLEEIAQLLGCWNVPEPARLLFTVAIYTGLRAGELWALRWERIRLHGSAPQIVVAKSNRRKSTKSGKVRAVPLLEQAQEALREWHGLRGEPIEGLVFPGTDERQRPCGDDHGWADRSRGKQGVQRGHRSIAGIREGVRFHDLRHTCASHLLQGTWGREWTLEEVRDFLGHSSIVVTQKYAHLGAQRLHEAAAATRREGT